MMCFHYHVMVLIIILLKIHPFKSLRKASACYIFVDVHLLMCCLTKISVHGSVMYDSPGRGYKLTSGI